MTEHFEDVYGVRSSDLVSLEFLASLLGEALDLRFQWRDSSYGDCLVARQGNEMEVRIRYNRDVLDGEPLYPKFAEYDLLIMVNGEGRANADALKSKLQQVPDITFLSREIWKGEEEMS